jgi:hypothetical protein
VDLEVAARSGRTLGDRLAADALVEARDRVDALCEAFCGG